MSNGGDFSYMLACQASETFKAVAPVAGFIMQDIMDNCNPVNQVSILEIHGTQDDVTYWEGDPNNNDGWGAYPSIPNTISFFANMFGLTELSSTAFPDSAPTDGSSVNSDKYTEIGSCAQVWLYTVDGGGHDWPGAEGNMDISASREAWLFFEQLCVSPEALCDSININNISLNTSVNPNLISFDVQVFGYGPSVSYPGFALLNSVGDTLGYENFNTAGNVFALMPNAIETRSLDIVQNFSLPFNGFIHLVDGWFAGNSTTECIFPFSISVTGSEEMYDTKKLLEVKDVIGRKITNNTTQNNQPLFYIYNDGTVEKKIIIE